ncbi:Hypothetical protein PHPALM_17323 [Phytophthora palmivora]|uniref:Uncharacterized protein n=1 Tax=Phytophthora palmivora TaxID=4796 RepID=A0A2P4XML4_9STRA|nr:Hypothetical protein PHPALM_17323 [Phytophthora palmivora]
MLHLFWKNICGPLHVPSLTGCRYFLKIFIDDFSRFIFTYLFNNRSELYDCYKDFRRKALNSFRRSYNTLGSLSKTMTFNGSKQIIQKSAKRLVV